MRDDLKDRLFSESRISSREAASPSRAVPPPDDAALLPGPDDPYKAYGMPSNKPTLRLTCIMGKDGFKAGGRAYRHFQYVQLDSDGDDLGFSFTVDGQEFSIRFAGSKLWKLTVRGRNLIRCYDLLTLHRVPWIREADRDFRGESDKEPVILSIRIEEEKEEDAAQPNPGP